MIALYLGGARSGKSRLAEAAARNSGLTVHYLATAENHPSMQQRILRHKIDRPAAWQTHEVPFTLAATLQQYNQTGNLLLVDCLTLWLSNHLLRGDLEMASQQLLATLPQLQAQLILVSNEVGAGLIPDDPLSQAFVSASGQLHQQIAALADQVWYCQAGFATPLKRS